MEYPVTFVNADGVEIIALNEVQAAAIEREGFRPVEDKPARKKKQE